MRHMRETELGSLRGFERWSELAEAGMETDALEVQRPLYQDLRCRLAAWKFRLAWRNFEQ